MEDRYLKRVWTGKESEERINNELGAAFSACVQKELDQERGAPAPGLLLELDHMAVQISNSLTATPGSTSKHMPTVPSWSSEPQSSRNALLNSLPQSSLVALGVVIEEFIRYQLEQATDPIIADPGSSRSLSPSHAQFARPESRLR